jgi:hypothetical protein
MAVNHTNISKEKVLDILDQRMTELKETKERNKYRGLTMRDEYLIDGGITEIEILKERIKKYF